jgi:hypothetical protein
MVNLFIGSLPVVSTSCYNTFKISVTTAHIKTSTSVNTWQLSPHNSFHDGIVSLSHCFSNFLSRPELASCGLKIEHHVQQFIPLLFAVATRTLIVSTCCCLRMAVFSDVAIPASRRHITVSLQMTHIQNPTYIEAISIGAFARAGVTTSLAVLPFVHFAVTGAITQSLNYLAAARCTLKITSNYTLYTPY